MTVYTPLLNPPSFAVSFARLATIAVAPRLELQFNIMQNTLLGRLDKDIATLQDGGATTPGETAHLTRRIASATAKLAELEPYATRTSANKALVNATLDAIAEMSALADPTTLAEFEAKRAQVLDILDRIQTSGNLPVGMVNDGLKKLRGDTIASIEGIVTNDFLAQADIDVAVATLDALTVTMTDGLTLVELANDTAQNSVAALAEIKRSTEAELLVYEGEAKAALEKKIEDARDYYGRILSSLSYSLDSAVALTGAMNGILNPEKPPESGTMLDFIT
jgi:hypothetical protein